MDLLSAYGAVVGTAALGMSAYVALRDRARVKFELRFGFACMPQPLNGWTVTASTLRPSRKFRHQQAFGQVVTNAHPQKLGCYTT
ncbi:MAG: hypothetical protein ACYDAG_03165 [Chloroflexota bacterium]